MSEPMIQADSAAQAAAIWWARQIGAPTFDAMGDTGAAHERATMGMAGAMASMLAERNPVSAEQGERFAAALAGRVSELLGRCTYGVSLDVDYGPCLELAEAADAAGVSYSRFPWKTHMSVRADHVVAGLGYRAPYRLIWQAPDWQRPVCGTQCYDEQPGGRYEPRDLTCGLLRYHDGDHGDWQPDKRTCVGCGLSYAGHYAKRDSDGGFHEWEPFEAVTP